ncbi:hypothetical protein ACFLT1_03855 [Bacteroidota bacterium]
MKYIYPIIGVAGLLLVIIPALMHYRGTMEASEMKNLMFVGTVVWFAAAIPWLGKKKEGSRQ